MDRSQRIIRETLLAANRLPDDRLLNMNETAARFGVRRETLYAWMERGLISYILTPGGHRRFWESEIKRLSEDA